MASAQKRESSSAESELERLRRENALLRADLKESRDLTSIAPAFFGFLSPRGKLLCANDLSLEVVEASREEIVGQPFWDCPWWKPLPESAARVREAVLDAAAGKPSEFDIEYCSFTHGVQQVRWVSLRVIPQMNAEDSVFRISVSGIDITERKALEAQSSFEKHKLKTVFHASPAAMALWRGPEMMFEMVNPAYQDLFGDRPLLGLPFLEALPEFQGQAYMEILRKVYETGEPYVGREVLAQHRRSAEGPIEDRYYNFTYTRVTDQEGRPYGVYDHAVDVTDRIVARRYLEKKRSQLQVTVQELEKERSLREGFMNTLTHDLRTPLTAAKMSAQILTKKMAQAGLDAASVQKMAARIEYNMDRADRMIRDLLDSSRVRAGERLPMNIEPLALNGLVADTIEELSTIHGDRFVLRTEKKIEGYWSQSAVRRILENLCGNAVKYGGHSRPITVSLEATDMVAVLSVHNEGNPIPPHDIESLFDPFRRSEDADRSAQKGWGIGLTLVRGLANALGGHVSAASSQELGTTFRVVLPLDARENPSPQK